MLEHIGQTMESTMAQYGIYEAKTKLAELVKKVGKGERITITNRGEPVAELVPAVSRTDKQIREAINGLKAMRRGKMTQAQFHEWRSKGRRNG